MDGHSLVRLPVSAQPTTTPVLLLFDLAERGEPSLWKADQEEVMRSLAFERAMVTAADMACPETEALASEARPLVLGDRGGLLRHLPFWEACARQSHW